MGQRPLLYLTQLNGALLEVLLAQRGWKGSSGPDWPLGFKSLNYCTTVSNGYLGSRNDEERSEMRYVMRIAEFSESSNL